MRPIATDVAHSVDSVLVTQDVLCKNKAKPIKMPFGWVIHVCPRNHVSNGVKIGWIHSQPWGVTGWWCGLIPLCTLV